jgi:hypothetical protein
MKTVGLQPDHYSLTAEVALEPDLCRLRCKVANRTASWAWSLHLDPGGRSPWPQVQAYPDGAAFAAFARPHLVLGIMLAQPLTPAGVAIAPHTDLDFEAALPLPLRETALTKRGAQPFATPTSSTVTCILVGIELVVAAAAGTPARFADGGVAIVPLAKQIGVVWGWAVLPSKVTLMRCELTPDELGDLPASTVDHLLPVDKRRV